MDVRAIRDARDESGVGAAEADFVGRSFQRRLSAELEVVFCVS